MMRPAALILDLDGTLLDTLRDLADSMNSVLARLGLPVRPIDKYRYYVGEGIVRLAHNVLEQPNPDPALVNRLVEGMEEAYALSWNLNTRPYKGIPEMLDELQRRHIPFSILSNKPDDFTQKMVKHFFRRYAFTDVQGARTGVPRKPAPDAALELAQKMGVRPEEVMFLGDSRIDMQTAFNARMIGVGVTWGFREAAELKGNGARYIIHSPQELFSLL